MAGKKAMKNRRDFLKSAAVTGAAALVPDGDALAAQVGRGGSSDPPETREQL